MSSLPFIPTGSAAVNGKIGSPLVDGLRRLNNFLFLSELNKKSDSGDFAIEELRSAGLSRFQLNSRESRHIATYLNPNEHIRAGIRGHSYGVGVVLMVATDTRILYLHDIPLFSNFEEFAYDVVSGVSINRAAYLASVTVFTKFKTYQIDHINTRQAERFLTFIEQRTYGSGLLYANNKAEVAHMSRT